MVPGPSSARCLPYPGAIMAATFSRCAFSSSDSASVAGSDASRGGRRRGDAGDDSGAARRAGRLTAWRRSAVGEPGWQQDGSKPSLRGRTNEKKVYSEESSGLRGAEPPLCEKGVKVKKQGGWGASYKMNKASAARTGFCGQSAARGQRVGEGRRSQRLILLFHVGYSSHPFFVCPRAKRGLIVRGSGSVRAIFFFSSFLFSATCQPTG